MTRRRKQRQLAVGLAFLAPNILGFLTFTLVPLVFSLVLAFSNWDLRRHNMFHDESIKMIGFKNIERLFQGDDFWRFFGNTLFMMMVIPFSIAGSLGLALLLGQDAKTSRTRRNWVMILCAAVSVGGASFAILLGAGASGMTLLLSTVAGGILLLGFVGGSTVYRTLLYLPSFTSGVAVFILWKKLYASSTGPIDHALTPTLDALTKLVNASPAGLWSGAGWVLWIVGGLGFARFSFVILRNWFRRDFEVGTVLICLAVATIGALLCYGLGSVLIDLPARTAAGRLTPPNWLTDYYWAKPALMIVSFWAGVGSNNMLLYLAGISGISPELYEAADVDGAGRFQKFWNITWPQLAPTTFFIVVMSMIHGLQGGFEMARSMTQGGPAGATTTLSYFIYSEGFETGRLGYSSAVAWVLFAMLLLVTLFNWRFGGRYVND